VLVCLLCVLLSLKQLVRSCWLRRKPPAAATAADPAAAACRVSVSLRLLPAVLSSCLSVCHVMSVLLMRKSPYESVKTLHGGLLVHQHPYVKS
jgi:hypothetical protein